MEELQQVELQQDKNRQDIRNAALGYLARREHSYKELLNKIRTKYRHASDSIEPVLDELVQERLLSDQRFAESYVRARLNKGFGPERIALELREKGIDPSTTMVCLNHPDIDWQDAARKVWSKKFRISAEKFSALGFSEKAKQTNFLRYRGFRGEEIEAVFDKS